MSTSRRGDYRDTPQPESSGGNLFIWLIVGGLLLVTCLVGGVFTAGYLAFRAGRSATQSFVAAITPPANAQEALDGLRTNDFLRQSLSMDYVKRNSPDPALQPQVARELERLMTSNGIERMEAAEALIEWATPEQIPALITVMDSNEFPTSRSAAKALARLKDPRAIPVLAKGLIEMTARHDSAETLIKLGSAAELEVVKYVDHEDPFVRIEACRVLKSIGTAKSLPPLEAIIKRYQTIKTPQALTAITQIQDAMTTIQVKKRN